MADVGKIIERIRANGANVVMEGGRLRIANGDKLPAGALDFLKAHGRAIADWLDREVEFEERAAILEYDGGFSRPVAEGMTRVLMAHPPEGADLADWNWYVDQTSRIMDSHLRRAA